MASARTICGMFGGPKAIVKQLAATASVDSSKKGPRHKSHLKCSSSISQLHVIGAALSLRCAECPAVRNELSLMQNELALMITSNDGTLDYFLRACLIRCLTCIIFHQLSSDIVVWETIGDSALNCLFDLINAGILENSSELPWTAIESGCLLIDVLTARIKSYADARIFLREVAIVLKWALLPELEILQTPRLLSIHSSGITILETLCKLAIRSSSLSLPWFQAIKNESILVKLIFAAHKCTPKGDIVCKLMQLVTGIIDSILKMLAEERPLSRSEVILLMSIVKQARHHHNKNMTKKNRPHLKPRLIQLHIHYHTIALLACVFMLKKYKINIALEARTITDYRNNNKQQSGQDRHFYHREEKRSLVSDIIAMTWALVHINKRIQRAAVLGFRDLFSEVKGCILEHTDVGSLIDEGYFHILIVVREVCRVRSPTMKVLIYLENAMEVVKCLGGQILQQKIITHSAPLTTKKLLLEQIVLMHIVKCRLKRSRCCEIEEFINTIPWDDCEDVYTSFEGIMRIFNLVIILDQSKKQHSQNIKRNKTLLNSLMVRLRPHELQVELNCKDKIGPIMVRCPPIDKVISNAPLLALQIAEDVDFGSNNYRPVIVQLRTSSYDATEEFLCRIEFGTDYSDPCCDYKEKIHHLIKVIEIAYRFGSQEIVNSYLLKCNKLLNTQCLQDFLEIAMAVNCEKSVLNYISFAVSNKKQFRKSLYCFNSRHEFFTMSILRILNSITTGGV